MRRISLAWALSCLLLAACGDDTKPVQKDIGVKKDKTTMTNPEAGADVGPVADLSPTVDQPQVKVDQPQVKVDMPQVKVDAPKVDAPKTDVAKTDGPKVDAPKADLKKTDAAKVDGPKGDLPPAPANTKCATPEALSWGTSTTIVKNGDNSNSVNEYANPSVNCGLGSYYDFDGGQVYYKVTLAANKKYKALLLSPSADLGLYAFPASAACTQVGVEAGCTSPTPADPNNIYAADSQGSGGTEVIRIAPAAAGDWIIVVDSYTGSSSGRGPFTLTLTEFVAPTNTTCSNAKALTLAGTPKKAVETGDTGDSTDEFATVDCGNSAGPWPGPQLYYKLVLEGGKKYKVSLDAGSTDSALYAFPTATACNATAINTACTSPASDPFNIWNDDTYGSGEVIFIAPPASPTTVTWTIVVDSYAATEKGVFTLTVEEFTPPTNGVCATPETIALTTSPVTKTGDTSNALNQFGTQIDCGSSFQYDGNQLYYKVTLQNGKKYTFVLTPTGGWDPALYAFTDTTCTVATINTQCTATIKDDYGSVPETMEITPAGTTGTTDYIIVVDSYTPSELGAFSLQISWP
jgi:hypothetical protein